MIEKTVIILGAGASSDYGFPVGNALIKNILNREGSGFCVIAEQNGDRENHNKIFDFKEFINLPDEMLSEKERSGFKKRIEEMDPSQSLTIKLNGLEFFRNFISGLKLYRNSQIDYFLRTFSKYEKFGKVMIARQILKQEVQARDKIRTGDFKSIDSAKKDGQDWIGSFFANLIQKAKKPEDLKLISDKLTIVTFNYDLLFEHYLNEFCKGDDQWGEALDEFKKNLKIIHIYGKLGRFEWESEQNLKEIYGEEVFKTFALRSDNEHFGFLKNKYDYEKIRDLSEGIKVIGGEKHQEDLLHIKRARDAIYHKDCKKIFFFGFGFDKNNLSDCLQADRNKFKGKNVYCTIYDEGDEERVKIAVNEYIKNLKYVKDCLDKVEIGNPTPLSDYGNFQTAKQISSLLLYI